ncbi:hypothetical protein QCD60_30185 [Pokkaliibacter sp. MBI-7]|uniref:hypothetical protein n=1 Tax=Pokkaliibacter sp. MBI-7 TaxID=3040600 RepID=UPI002449F9A6|nr:hypothetical protein [Pokkaliibacter sp. MBI-7]MDH2430990.1 hypothetical protein [Pokkaliibacter sp. MBI-7]MDH2436785.1 hypothetical protein [Pokkaliibacter sp. MBI-7]
MAHDTITMPSQGTEKWNIILDQPGTPLCKAVVDDLIERSCCSDNPAILPFLGYRGSDEARRQVLIDTYGKDMASWHDEQWPCMVPEAKGRVLV